ncbi:hypothetical protein TNCV_3173761 [Trichonephila clavipes]|nr:hypothetical protein TNCV_3173761 [Trichonephila clavipes]
MEWRSPAPSHREKRLEQKSPRSKRGTSFDSQGIIHKDSLPEGTEMNAARFIEMLTRFMKRLRRVWTQFAYQGSWFLVHDNDRSHTANIVKKFLKKREGCKLNIPILARSQLLILLPILTTQTPIEKKEI